MTGAGESQYVAELEELTERAFWEKRCMSSPMHECLDDDDDD